MKAYRSINHSGIQIIQNEVDEAVVAELYVDPEERGKGVARRLMQATCRDADRENVTLYLKPHPYGSYDIVKEVHYPPGTTYSQLCKFYRSFGFRFAPHLDNVMKRKPKKVKPE